MALYITYISVYNVYSIMTLGIVRGISYGLFAPPDPFVPHARALGAHLLRVYFFWSQLEPRPGEYHWDAVDALLAQLDGTEDLWITLCSSCPWATRVATDFLPSSPAHDQAAFADLVRQTVRHCGGRVRYWQCNNEPTNATLWSGTADDYVAQLRVMHDAVKAVDPDALVVLGGCGYDVLSSPLDSEERRFSHASRTPAVTRSTSSTCISTATPTRSRRTSRRRVSSCAPSAT